jgi:hypothetical protein
MDLIHTEYPYIFKRRLELKSLKRQTKAEEEGTRGPFLISLRLSLKALLFEPFLRENSGKTCSRKHHTILKNRMAVLRNRYPPNIPPAGADPLLKTSHLEFLKSYGKLRRQAKSYRAPCAPRWR